jgi:hypothetical protein
VIASYIHDFKHKAIIKNKKAKTLHNAKFYSGDDMEQGLILGKELRDRPPGQSVLGARITQNSDGLWFIELNLSWLEPNPFFLGEFEVLKKKEFKMLNFALRHVFEKTDLTTVIVVRNADLALPERKIM